uniref:Uncharacterized protein n=1 Tax=Anguilla anguilla TaxID=7936 RepID=A0A0E9P9J4_ANGAN
MHSFSSHPIISTSIQSFLNQQMFNIFIRNLMSSYPLNPWNIFHFEVWLGFSLHFQL